MRRSVANFLASGYPEWTVARVAAEHGVSERTVYRWRRPVERGGCAVYHAHYAERRREWRRSNARAGWRELAEQEREFVERLRECRERGWLPPSRKCFPRGRPFGAGPDPRRGPGVRFEVGNDARRYSALPGEPAVLREAVNVLVRGPARERALRRRRERYAADPWYWNPATDAEYECSGLTRR